jgi:type II secretory pathway pseudopilin PulG
MRRSRGFVNYEIWIVLTLVAIAAAIIIPAVQRGVARARLRRAEIEVIRKVAALEGASFGLTYRYLDSLPPVLTPGTRLLSLKKDSVGWSVAITGDSTQRWPVTCGVFVGPPSLAPNPVVTASGRIGCW